MTPSRKRDAPAAAREDKLADFRAPDGSLSESAVAALIDHRDELDILLAQAKGHRDQEAGWHDAFRELVRVNHYPHISQEEWHNQIRHRRYEPETPFDLDAHHDEVLNAKATAEVAQEFIDEELEAEKARVRELRDKEIDAVRATDHGAAPHRTPQENLEALQAAFAAAEKAGTCVLLPWGVYAPSVTGQDAPGEQAAT